MKKKAPIDVAIAAIVKQKRIERRLSQAAIARCLNVSRTFVGQVESGQYASAYSLNHLNDLARLFDCSPKELVPQRPV